VAIAPTGGAVYWFRNNGGSPVTWTQATVASSLSKPSGVFVADVDADGLADVVSSTENDNFIRWYKGVVCPPGRFGTEGVAPCSVCALGRYSAAGADICRNGFAGIDVRSSTATMSSAVAADLDGDGRLDLLATHLSDYQVVWYRSTGGATLSFTPSTIATLPNPPGPMHAADLNGDGRLDVLTVSAHSNAIYWFRNDGGSPSVAFTTYTLSANAHFAYFASTADIDLDGRLDVIAALMGTDTDTVAWYRNEGGSAPTFTQFNVAVGAAIVRGPTSVFPADLDGDGRVDVMSSSHLDNKIVWYRNVPNTSGTVPLWTAQVISNSALYALCVHAADVDGDGRMDVLSASPNDNKVAWYKSSGGTPPFTWTEYVVSSVASKAQWVVAADVDGDGRMDVLSTSFGNNRTVWYKSGGGSVPTWTPTEMPSVVTGALFVATADVNSDGRLDVISVGAPAAGTGLDSKLSVFVNGMCPRGSFGPGGLAPCTPCPVGTFNNATLQSACVACPAGRFGSSEGSASPLCTGVCRAGFYCPARSSSATAVACPVGMHSPAGAAACLDVFTASTITTSADGAFSVFAADVDSDGRLDVLSASTSDDRVVWYKNNGGTSTSLSWTPRNISTSADGAISVSAADLDGDGRLDVLSGSITDNKVMWYKNEGGSPVVLSALGISASALHAHSVRAADFDGDGRLDVVAGNSQDKIAWYWNGGGNPLTWTPLTVSTAVAWVTSVHVGDVDGDGRLDVLSASYGDNRVAWHKNGVGSPVTWTMFTISATANGARSVFAADVDGDGRLDVLSASQLDNKIAWYRNGGGSPVVWTVLTISSSAAAAYSVHAADVDGDGRVDVLSASYDDDKIAWYQNGGGSPVAWTAFTVTAGADGAHTVFAADLDGDGALDVLSASAIDDKVAWYRNTMCPRGRFGLGGYAPCAPCPPGRFGNTSLLEACEVCPAGRYGSGGSFTALCTGPCSAGFVCAAGSTNATAAACPPGKYSLAGAGVCSDSLESFNVTTAADNALSVFAADVDGDGRVDVLSASYLDDKIEWHRNGGGSPVVWTSFVITLSADGAYSVHAADLDGDGRLDVLSAGFDDHTIAWYKNGGGSPVAWTAFSITTAAISATCVHAADLDDDGRLDVLSASSLDGVIAWYRNGGGSPVAWTPHTITTSALGARSVYTADLNGDGRLDVLSASLDDDKIAWYRNGGGSPVAWTTYNISTSALGAISVHAADMDADGRMDVLAASNHGDRIIWYKNGGGDPVSWAAFTVSTTAYATYSVHAADVDGDGFLDALSANSNADSVTWYKNIGGSPLMWAPHTITTSVDGVSSVYAADVDSDGRLDVLSASRHDDKISWYKNLMCPRGSVGAGGYAPCAPCAPGRYAGSSLQAACELCPAGRYGSGGSFTASCTGPCAPGFACPAGSPNATAAACPSGKYSLAGAGACSDALVAHTISTTANGTQSVYAVDVNGDGRVDVLSANPSANEIVWYMNGGGVPVVWTSYVVSVTAVSARSVYAADVDGDGLVDVLSASSLDGKIAWYKNGGGSPVVWTPYTITTTALGAYSVFGTDVDGDGRLDVLSASSADDRIVWYKNGGGSPVVWTLHTITTTANKAVSVYAADVNGDGLVDVLSASLLDDKIAWYMNGGGSPVVWTPYNVTTTASSAYSVFAADVDGDGRLDVLSASDDDDKIAWYKNGGGSPVVWTPYVITTAADGARSVFAADVDGDGRLDVLSASVYDDKIAWYRNGGGNPVAWTPFVVSLSADFAQLVYAVDVDGDGRLDVLSASTDDDKVAWYRNMMCPRGSFGPGGYAPCAPCPPGRFGNTSLLEACEVCPAGRFGAGGSFTALCTGPCSAGFVCAAGSTNASAAACPSGKYSLPGSGACSDLLEPYTITSSADGAGSVCSADVDGDGRVDVLSSSWGNGNITWYRNSGGVPVVWTPFPISSVIGASSVFVADVDGDGAVDVLSSNGVSDTIAWYRNGGGTPVVWTPFNISTSADGAQYVHAADVDSDGRVDVLSASFDDNRIAWYRNGGGSPVAWTAYNISTTADGAHSVYVEDVDGDGRLDVLSSSVRDDRVVWYQNGGGVPVVWSPHVVAANAGGPTSVFAADVDSDGRMDVLSAGANVGTIVWYKNAGGSPMSWLPFTISSTAAGAYSVRAADVNGDGRLDVLSASKDNDRIAWYRNGGGDPVSWTAVITSETADAALSVHVADVDGDGALDVLSASGFDDKVAWYRNTMCPRGRFGTGGYAPCAPCPPGRFGNTSLLEACEVCPAGRYGSGGNTNASCTGPCAPGFACPVGSPNATAAACPPGKYSLAGAGVCSDSLESFTVTTAADGAISVYAADLDRDGRVDVLSASQTDDKVMWYKNGGGSPVVWTPYVIAPAANGAWSVHAADLDGDGLMDVLAASLDDDRITWYRNGGGNPVVWTPGVISATADGAVSVFAADINGDGRLDVLSASTNDDKIAWYRNGGGSPVVWANHTITSTADGALSVFAADVDGDGLMDVLSASPNDDKIVWHRNGGSDGQVWTAFAIATGADFAACVSAADLDGDGSVDVLSAVLSDNKIMWYKNGGGNPVSWAPFVISSSALGARFVHAADVDGDGRLDVLSASTSDGKIAWYRNGGGSPLVWTAFTITTAAAGAMAVHTADLDGDGRLDVLSASEFTDTVAWYKNTMCPRGSFGPGGHSPCSLCPPGRFSAAAVQVACEACPSGRFGSGSGLLTAACSGPCSAGFACGAGSTNSTGAVCPAGTYSLSGAGGCTGCPAGVYGSLPGLTQATCTAPCRPGRFGAEPGLTSPTCTGNCTAGYACPAGSTSPTVQLCPVGQYSLAGAGTCSNCPGGTYGNSVGLTTPACSGPCAEGFVCPPGSNTSTPAPSCPAGRFGVAATGACDECPAGQFGASTGAIGLSSCSACAAGFFGATAGLTVPQCSGACPAGYYCAGAGCLRMSCRGTAAHPYLPTDLSSCVCVITAACLALSACLLRVLFLCVYVCMCVCVYVCVCVWGVFPVGCPWAQVARQSRPLAAA
jgi:hypothetical protein